MKNIDRSTEVVNNLFKNIVIGFYVRNHINVSKDLSDDAIVALHNKVDNRFDKRVLKIYQNCTDCLIDIKELLEDFYVNCGNNFIDINQLNICVNVNRKVYKVEEKDLITLYGIIIRNNVMYFEKKNESDLNKEIMDFVKQMVDKYDSETIEKYVKATNEKFNTMRNIYYSIREFVDLNGRFVDRMYVTGDIMNLCNAGIDIDVAKKISSDASLSYINSSIEREVKQIEESKEQNEIQNTFSVKKAKKEQKTTSIIVLQSELDEYFDGDTPKRVLSNSEIKKIKNIMTNIGMPSTIIRKRLENIAKFNNDFEESKKKRKSELMTRVISEEGRIILMQAEELKSSAYFKSYNVDKTLEDIELCINDLLDDESNQDYIDMINLLITDLKEKILMINSINDSVSLKYNNSQQ